jgi:hypothetical protein
MDDERAKRVRAIVEEECRQDKPLFRLAASSGYNYLHTHGVVWRAGLGDALVSGKAEMKVILASPFSSFAVTRALANDVVLDQWDDRGIPGALRQLVELKNVSIRVTGFPVNCSLFFTSSAVFYDPYLWGRPSRSVRTENNFWVFEFTNKDDPGYACYHLLEKHFDFLAGEIGEGGDLLHVGPKSIREFMGEDDRRYEELRLQFRARIKRIREGENYDPTVTF